jgi:hypothetical protein
VRACVLMGADEGQKPCRGRQPSIKSMVPRAMHAKCSRLAQKQKDDQLSSRAGPGTRTMSGVVGHEFDVSHPAQILLI